MKNPTTPSGALAELAAQHARLRDMIERCEDLADGVDAGHVEPAQLLGEVVALRIAFDTHNQFEEQLLRPAPSSECFDAAKGTPTSLTGPMHPTSSHGPALR